MYEHIFASILEVAAFLSPIEENLLFYIYIYIYIYIYRYKTIYKGDTLITANNMLPVIAKNGFKSSPALRRVFSSQSSSLRCLFVLRFYGPVIPMGSC